MPTALNRRTLIRLAAFAPFIAPALAKAAAPASKAAPAVHRLVETTTFASPRKTFVIGEPVYPSMMNALHRLSVGAPGDILKMGF